MGITQISVQMKHCTQGFIYFSSVTISVALHIQESVNSGKESIVDVTKDYIIPMNSEEIQQKSEDISIENIDSWWNYSTMFYLFSALSIILTFSLLYAVNKYSSVKEKEVIKFSCPKTKDGWYADNMLATEKRVLGQCNISEKDFIVVWS